VTDALALVRLTEQGDKLPGQLSGGQQQRVAIARAVVVEPPLVLMDEPLSNLDAKLRLEMRAEIRRIHTLIGSATIYVTHDQDEALSLADRIVVLRDGQVRQVGTPQDLYSRPAHADVAEFMGYRNILRTAAALLPDGRFGIAIGDVRVPATPVEAIPDGHAIAAVRPEDLTPVPGAPIRARVEAAEYRGRDFYASGRTVEGLELYFRSDRPLAVGEDVRLSADPARILVFAA
jgi:putative spermidine/putrescine transport system ATP-binding protein